jgi:hypothetical protein
MIRETGSQSSRSGSSELNDAQANPHSERSPTQTSIGKVMVVIAVIAILLGSAVQLSRGSPTLLLILAVPLLVVLPSRKHLSLAFGKVLTGPPKDYTTLRTMRER